MVPDSSVDLTEVYECHTLTWYYQVQSYGFFTDLAEIFMNYVENGLTTTCEVNFFGAQREL